MFDEMVFDPSLMYITHGLVSNNWIHDLKSAFLHLKFKGFRLPILPLFFHNLANLFQYHQSSIYEETLLLLQGAKSMLDLVVVPENNATV